MSKYKAIITGGSRGIGKAILDEFATHTINGEIFSDVAFIYNNCDDCAKQIELQYANSDVKVKGYKVDVSSFEDVQKAVDEIIKVFGIDNLSNLII